MAGLPGGTVTFLVTDIEGSTRLLQRLGDGAYAAVLAKHQEILRAVFAASAGREVSIQGDGFVVAFSKASDAVGAAIAAQRALATHRWPPDVAMHVRMGVHTGEPTSVPGDYVGLDVHRAVRVCAAGHGGQILLSGAAAALVQGVLPEGVALRELGRHRLKDLKDAERLVQVLHHDLAAEFPPLNSLGTTAHNLPQSLTSFIGREHALATVTDLLRTNRLVTLAGAGGCGKTRLALELARGEVGAYTDGVWLVELAALTDPALVPGDVAAALNVREVADPSAPALAAAIGARHLLLVLDNCEHLVAACAGLAETMLRACPKVRVLATSREPLGVPGETVWRVPPLARPGLRPSFDELVRCESVCLFAERASAAAPDFALTERNAESVAAICRRLDGIPLAIELAAARVQALPIDTIAARLNDRFRLLVRGSRTALPRHRTLRATIDWSYDLLSEAERVVLCRLSVFAGGWSLEAAEAVCGGGDIDASAVVDLMTQIVLKSLAAMDDSGGDVRYRLLETVREYGRARLAESGETAVVRSRHLAWYAALAERAAPELLRSDQTAWFDRLEREHDNVRSAVEWALAGGDVEAGLRLAAAIWRFWDVRGHFVEGGKLLNELLERGALAPQTTRAAALAAAGSLAVYELGDYAAGCARLEEALKIYRSAGNDKKAAGILNALGVAAFAQGDFPRARSLYEESLGMHRAAGDQQSTAFCLHNLGRLAYYRCEYHEARRLMETSLAILRELDDQQHVATALIGLGSAAIRIGDHTLARQHLFEALELEKRVGDMRLITYLLDGFAKLAVARGRLATAVRLFAAAQALRESIHLSLPKADVDELNVWAARARESLAPESFSSAWALGRAMTIDEAILTARNTAGENVPAGNGAGAPMGG